MNKKEKRRAQVIELASKRGIQIIKLPSGAFWLTGNGIDIKTMDLSLVIPYELMPPQPRG